MHGHLELAGGPKVGRDLLKPARETCYPGRLALKTIMSALLALSVVSGYAATAFADTVPQSIWEQLDREGRGGHPT
jgi:hypothetical protein